MKKTTVTLLIVALASTLVGQGSVDFKNFGQFPTPADRLVYFGQVGGDKLVGTNYAAALYYTRPGTSDLTLLPTAIRLFRDPTTTMPGTWNTFPGSYVFFPDVGIGQTITLDVRVWDIQQFSSWEGAIAGGGVHGESAPFSYITPVIGGPPTLWLMDNLRAFAVIPEPPVMVLWLVLLSVFGVIRRLR
jgi:hypothetical protein